MTIKEFYLNEYPTDDLGSEINENATFIGLLKVLNTNEDVYEYIGIGDSLIRERLFSNLATEIGVDYNFIYDLWLSDVDYTIDSDITI